MKVTQKIDVLFAQGPVEVLTVEYQSGRNTLELEVSTEEWNAGQQAWTHDIIVTYDGLWTATTEEDWITLLTHTPGRVTIMTATNETGAERTGTVTITPEEGDAVTVTVKQEASVLPVHAVVPSVLEISKSGGKAEFVLYCKEAWTGHTSTPWARLVRVDEKTEEEETTTEYTPVGSGRGTTKLALDVEENTTGSDRRATMTFRAGKHLLTLSYSQVATDPEPEQEAEDPVSPEA